MVSVGMKQRSEEIVNNIKHLPSLPAILQKLLMILEDIDCSAKDIERVVTTDPALTVRILKLANSPLYKGTDEVTTISQAVTRLGFMKLRDVAISIGATETLSDLADEKIQQAYWHHAVYTATCANILAKTAGMPVPEVTFVVGLLHDIGELVLAAISPLQYASLQKIEPHLRLKNEEELFGTTHPRVGNMLLKQWELPKGLCDAVRLHHTEQVYLSKREPLMSNVALADMLSKVHCLGSEPDCSSSTLFQLIKRAGVEINQIADVLHQVDQQVADTQRHLEIAGDVSFLTPAISSRVFKVALITKDLSMKIWLEQLLSYLGHTAIPMQDFFENPDNAHMVILDPKAASSGLIDQIEPAIEQMRDHVVVLASQTNPLPAELRQWNFPEIGLFLTQGIIKSGSRRGIPGG